MTEDPGCVAVIPARRGSKRTPHKNRLRIGGRSLLERTLDAARESAVFQRTILTTDDEELVAEAARFRIDIHMRPPELATDQATSADVMRAVIREYSLEDSTIVLLQLTSPFRTAEDIRRTLASMNTAHADSAVSVCRWRFPPSPPFGTVAQGANLGPAGQKDAWSSLGDARDSTWALNGAVYAFKARKLIEQECIYDELSGIHEMEAWRSLDIDYPDDVKLAEALAHHYGI